MNSYPQMTLRPCVNCEKPISSGYMYSGSWSHTALCCSSECGLEWEKKLESWRKRKWRPGEKSPVNGEYEVVGVRGGRTGWFRRVWLLDRFPPTPKPGQLYRWTGDYA